MSNFDKGWPDAISKIGLAIMAVCSLATALLNRCDQQKTNKALDTQFSAEYWQELKEGKK